MPRGIPWDSLPNPYHQPSPQSEQQSQVKQQPEVQNPSEIQRKVDLSRDLPDIGRRIAFGALVCYTFSYLNDFDLVYSIGIVWRSHWCKFWVC
jgi:hypothetical protein